MKKTNSVLAFVLLAACFLSLGAGSALAVDLDRACTLTVQAAADSTGYLKDLSDSGTTVTLDLYRIANAIPVENYDTYVYEFIDPFTADDFKVDSSTTNDDWRQMGQSAAKLIKAAPADFVKTTVAAGKEISDLKAGLYLILAHDDAKDYWREVKDDENVTLVTTAKTKYFEYRFEPQLISLPNKPVAEYTIDEQTVTGSHTAFGDWEYNVSAVLKPSREYRLGDLKIVKTLEGYVGTEPATFVVKIDAMWEDVNLDDELFIYSDVRTLTFTSDGTQTYTIKETFPIGTEVTVTEVYSGAHYSFTGDNEKTAVITITDEENLEPATVSFTNTFDWTIKGGHGIENHFENDGTTWRWAGREGTPPDITGGNNE